MPEILDRLKDKIKPYSDIDRERILKAFDIASEAHKTQERISGEPYVVHPVEVALILIDMTLDANTIIAAILHDVIEDTEITYEDVASEFSQEVADLVDGVTKLGKIKYKTKEEQQADNVRKMLLAMAKDMRVILIKLADRLHNMRTLKFMRPEKQVEKSKEVFDIYAPLAHRLGMSKIKWELEDLAFRYMKPDEYERLQEDIGERREEREAYIKEICNELNEELVKNDLVAEIDGRPKHFYSIYKKMMDKNKTIDQIFDLTAIRIILTDKHNQNDCYRALGVVHTLYKHMPGRFKDYIAKPKPNRYQSLHSTVIGKTGKPFEVQIRTMEMHIIAEYGIAAHWSYKEKKDPNSEESFTKWINEMMDWQKDTSDAKTFIEDFKIDLFSDEIFVFTPNGEIIDLPNEATPIDFAYKIHTDVGNRCIGVKVNGRMVPLDYHLQTGEIVEIITSSVAKGPSIAWLNIAKSNQAKTKIKAWIKKFNKPEFQRRGKEILEKESKKMGYNFSELSKGEAYDKIMKRYNVNSVENLYAAVGAGDISFSTILTRLREAIEKTKKEQEEQNNEVYLQKLGEQLETSNKNPNKDIVGSSGVIVKGENNLLCKFARCCNPVYGDKIVGYITTRDKGVSIHTEDCKNYKNLADREPNRTVEVEWGSSKGLNYLVDLRLMAKDRNGLLADIVGVINDLNVSLNNTNAHVLDNGYAEIMLKIKVNNVEELNKTIKFLRKVAGVREITRIKN